MSAVRKRAVSSVSPLKIWEGVFLGLPIFGRQESAKGWDSPRGKAQPMIHPL